MLKGERRKKEFFLNVLGKKKKILFSDTEQKTEVGEESFNFRQWLIIFCTICISIFFFFFFWKNFVDNQKLEQKSLGNFDDNKSTGGTGKITEKMH